MPLITKKIDSILKNKNMTRYKVCRLINFKDSAFNQMARGEIPFSKKAIEKLLPILEVSIEEFDSWILADKYSKDLLEFAIKAKQEAEQNPELYKNKLILTVKIDEILKLKRLSRTALSKIVKRSQSGLNKVIIGKETLSENTAEKLSPVLNVSKEQLRAWVIADKYDLKTLSLAVET